MHLRHISVAGLAAAIGWACAAPPPVQTPAPSTVSAGGPLAAASTPVRWTGTLQPMQQRTAQAAPTAQNKAVGSVFLATAGQHRTRIRLTISASAQASSSLQWAVLPGRCGSPALPLMPVERFPTIDVGSQGRGEVDTEMPFPLPSSGSLHVNVYWRGQSLDDILTCANLRRESGS